MRRILICSYLEPEHVERIRAAAPEFEVVFRPDLLPRPRYEADHVGAPCARNADQAREFYRLMEGAEVLFDFDYVDVEAMVRHAAGVRWIQASSSGIGQFYARAGLDRLPAVLTTAAGVHARPLAEFALWGILTFAKNFPQAEAQQRAHCWQRFHNDDLEGRTLAIAGMGRIGREVARLGRAFGMRVVGAKRSVAGCDPADFDADALGTLAEWRSLLPEADYVVLVAPHTAETEGMMDRRAFAAMKPGAVLVNIGRGALVDEEALLEALAAGRLGGAVLDVAAQEPLPPEHPLWSAERVIVFPHSASTSRNENRRLVALFVDNLSRYREGKPLRNVFDRARLY